MDSPMESSDAAVPCLSESESRDVSALLAAAPRASLVLGSNAVCRNASQLAVVFVCTHEAAPVLLQHIHEQCVVAQCRMAALGPVSSEALGKAMGVHRVLAVGVKRGAKEEEQFARFGSVPNLPWLQAALSPSFRPLKTGATNSAAPDAVYDARADRKAKINAKMKALKLKRDAEKKPVRQNNQTAKRQKIVAKAPTSTNKASNLPGKR